MSVVTEVIDRLEKILERLRILEVKVACGNYDSSDEMVSISDKLGDTVKYMKGVSNVGAI